MPPLPPAVPLRDVDDLRAGLEATLGGYRWGDAEWGVLVVSLDTGDTILAVQPETPLAPASNVKLLTTAAALHVLGPEYRFRTWLMADGPVSDGVLEGDLVLYGTGDPGISARFYGSREEVFHRLIDQLELAGIHTVTGDLVADASFLPGPLRDAGWERRDLNEHFTAGISALSYNENVVSLPDPARRAGRAAPGRDRPAALGPRGREQRTHGDRARPPPAGDPPRRSPRAGAHRGADRHRHARRVAPDDRRRARGTSSARLSARCSKSAVSSFAARPARSTSPRTPRCAASRRPGSADPVRRSSPRTSPGPSPTTSPSSIGNRTTSSPSSSTGSSGGWRRESGRRKRVQPPFGRHSRPSVSTPPGWSRSTGSGLSPANRVSARSFVDVIDRMGEGPLWPEYWATLPRAGTRGELGRMYQTAAADNLRAKTGTIDGVSALSGLVRSRDGERFAFSIMVNRTPSETRAKRVENQIGTRLAEFRRDAGTAPASAPETPPPARTLTAFTARHRVARGENLSAIAYRYGVTVEEILSVNPRLRADRIIAGPVGRDPAAGRTELTGRAAPHGAAARHRTQPQPVGCRTPRPTAERRRRRSSTTDIESIVRSADRMLFHRMSLSSTISSESEGLMTRWKRPL